MADHVFLSFQHPTLSIKFCLKNLRLSKQVCLIIRCGSCSCQLWSECVTRGTLTCWFQFLRTTSYPWQGAHLAFYINTCDWTHTWYKHTCQSCWVETGCWLGGTPEQQNKCKNLQSQSKRNKREIQRCARAIYAFFHLQFTFTQGRNLHFNFGGDIWELLKTPQL